jgi:uncharacterized alpha/beta hydrolase family protein
MKKIIITLSVLFMLVILGGIIGISMNNTQHNNVASQSVLNAALDNLNFGVLYADGLPGDTDT